MKPKQGDSGSITCMKSENTHVRTTDDCIRRQDAMELVRDVCDAIMSGCDSYYDAETGDEVYKDILEVDAILKCNKEIRIALKNMPSAQSDRDIPRKPIEGCSLSGRKKVKEATCRNCNFFLSHFHFYGEGKRITYCEHCGQAIDWEGWEWDE